MIIFVIPPQKIASLIANLFTMQPQPQPTSPKQPKKAGYTNYASPVYWQDRYKQMQKGERFDWLQDYCSLASLLDQSLQSNRQSTILNIGCGNGSIQDDLYLAGYHSITNIDISPSIIQQMKSSNTHKYMKYAVMDATNLKFADESFDFVLDKSTIDALQCSEDALVITAKMIKEIYRVLRPRGVYFIVSFGHPRDRMEHLQRGHLCFDVEVKKLPENEITKNNNMEHYVYICRKSKRPKPKKDWETVLKELIEEQKRINEEDDDE